MSRRRWLVSGLILLGALAWHLRPILVWQGSVAPRLRAHANAQRLRVETRREFPEAPADWPRLRVGGLSLRAPIRADARARCAACRERCLLRLEAGTLAVLDAPPPPESFEEIANLIAPDERDLSPWRSAARNWDTLRALEARVGLEGEPPAAFRFRNQASHGVVSRFEASGSPRWRVHAFGADGRPARVLEVGAPAPGAFPAILGSLAVAPAGGSAARCDD